MTAYRLRPLQVGDVGWIAHRQGLLYAQAYGWDKHHSCGQDLVGQHWTRDLT